MYQSYISLYIYQFPDIQRTLTKIRAEKDRPTNGEINTFQPCWKVPKSDFSCLIQNSKM